MSVYHGIECADETIAKDHAEVCKKHGHRVVPWDDPATMRIGWLCKTCRTAWLFCLLKTKGAVDELPGPR